MMGAVGRIDAREAHRGRGEPVNPNPRCKGFLIWNTNHALRRNRNLVAPLSEDIRNLENVAFLAADVRWKELGQEKDAHQCAPDGTLEPLDHDHQAAAVSVRHAIHRSLLGPSSRRAPSQLASSGSSSMRWRW